LRSGTSSLMTATSWILSILWENWPKGRQWRSMPGSFYPIISVHSGGWKKGRVGLRPVVSFADLGEWWPARKDACQRILSRMPSHPRCPWVVFSKGVQTCFDPQDQKRRQNDCSRKGNPNVLVISRGIKYKTRQGRAHYATDGPASHEHA